MRVGSRVGLGQVSGRKRDVGRRKKLPDSTYGPNSGTGKPPASCGLLVSAPRCTPPRARPAASPHERAPRLSPMASLPTRGARPRCSACTPRERTPSTAGGQPPNRLKFEFSVGNQWGTRRSQAAAAPKA